MCENKTNASTNPITPSPKSNQQIVQLVTHKIKTLEVVHAFLLLRMHRILKNGKNDYVLGMILVISTNRGMHRKLMLELANDHLKWTSDWPETFVGSLALLLNHAPLNACSPTKVKPDDGTEKGLTLAQL